VSKIAATCIYAVVHNAQCDIKETEVNIRSLDEQAYDRDGSERVTIKWKERKSKQRGKVKCTGVNETWPVHAYIKCNTSIILYRVRNGPRGNA